MGGPVLFSLPNSARSGSVKLTSIGVERPATSQTRFVKASCGAILRKSPSHSATGGGSPIPLSIQSLPFPFSSPRQSSSARFCAHGQAWMRISREWVVEAPNSSTIRGTSRPIRRLSRRSSHSRAPSHCGG